MFDMDGNVQSRVTIRRFSRGQPMELAQVRRGISVQSASQTSKIKRKKKNQESSWINMEAFGIIWVIFCISGSLYQTYILSIDYFSYPVTAEIKINLEIYFFVPATSLCFTPSNILALDQFDSDHPCVIDNSGPDCEHFLLYDVSISELMNNLTVDLVGPVVSAMFVSHNVTWKAEPLSQVLSPFYKSGKKCLRIYKDQTQKVNYDFMSERLYTGRCIVRFSSYGNHTGNVDLFVHRKGSYPRGFTASYYRARFEVNSFYTLAVKQTRTGYLSAPYFSRCVDYRERNLETREHCIEKCISKLLDRKEGKNYTDIQMTLTDFRSDQRLIDFTKTPEMKRSVYHYNKECNYKCPLNCVTRIYTPIWFSGTNSSSKFPKGDFGFDLTHTEPRYLVTFSSKYTLIEFLTYLASIISLWFGFVFLDFLTSIRKYCNQIIVKKRQKTNVSVNIHVK